MSPDGDPQDASESGGVPGDESDGTDDGSDPPTFDPRTATLRDATESDPLFGERVRPGETTDPGLVAGSRDDPVLVAGVGYPLLGDLAVGTVVAYRVADWDLPGVAVADCSHTPVAAYQTITDGDHDRVVLVGAEKRGGELNDGTPSKDPGAVHERDPDEYAVSGDIVDRVAESAMGSNTVENVVLVSKSVGTLPDDTRIIAVEPAYDSWGTTVEEFTDPVEAAVEDVLDRILEYVDDES